MVALGGMDQHSEERTEELAGMDRHTWRNGQTHLEDFIGTLGGMDGCTDSNGQTLLEEWTDTLGGMCRHTAVSCPQRRAVKVSKQTRKDSHR